jgi:hypothetical protein
MSSIQFFLIVGEGELFYILQEMGLMLVFKTTDALAYLQKEVHGLFKQGQPQKAIGDAPKTASCFDVFRLRG